MPSSLNTVGKSQAKEVISQVFYGSAVAVEGSDQRILRGHHWMNL